MQYHGWCPQSACVRLRFMVLFWRILLVSAHECKVWVYPLTVNNWDSLNSFWNLEITHHYHSPWVQRSVLLLSLGFEKELRSAPTTFVRDFTRLRLPISCDEFITQRTGSVILNVTYLGFCHEKFDEILLARSNIYSLDLNIFCGLGFSGFGIFVVIRLLLSIVWFWILHSEQLFAGTLYIPVIFLDSRSITRRLQQSGKPLVCILCKFGKSEIHR